MVNNVFKIVAVFVIGFCGGLFASQFSWPEYQTASISAPIIESREVFIQENTALQDHVKKTEKAIVGIKTKTKTGETISGSGLVVTTDGLVITLAEIIPLKGNYIFFIDGKTPDWKILKRDTKNNLALIKLDLSDLTTVGFSDFEKLRLGERVFLNGIFFDNNKPLSIVNEGVVKFFTDKGIETNMTEKKALMGSALFDIKGELLGLNTIDDEERVTAIPINKIKDFLGY